MNLYRLTPDARKDLRSIRDWILSGRPDRAETFVAELLTVFRMLNASPLIGRDRADLRLGLRSFGHGNYTIFYRPTPGGIEAIRVIYGRRDLSRLFGR